MKTVPAAHHTPSTLSRLLLLASTLFIVMSLPLMVRLVDRLRFESAARAQAQVVGAQVKAKEQELAKLREALEFARTDGYVEYWARVQNRMSKPGEVIVIPSDGTGSPRPTTPWWQDFLK